MALPSAIETGGDVVAGATALAGLILVFLGATSTVFSSYTKEEQRAVRSRFQRRAWFAFIGFALALLSAALALVGKWLHQECAALTAVFTFGAALILTLFAALFSVREIK